jgi:hypothetical protein
MVSDHRSMGDTATLSGDDVSDKHVKQALENAHVVSWLKSPPAYKHSDSDKASASSSKWCRPLIGMREMTRRRHSAVLKAHLTDLKVVGLRA